jgi:hypothetical protein
MRTLNFSLLAAVLFQFATANADPSIIPPMIDGRCEEYNGLNATQVKMDEAVTLHVYQSKHFVWLCYDYPEGSYGTLDLRVEAPGLKEAMNLHISAQLGDWPADVCVRLIRVKNRWLTGAMLQPEKCNSARITSAVANGSYALTLMPFRAKMKSVTV